ncbi:unnamed protein product [Phytomonas sp. EM1]|nr:unnamed protein product [Phytomonas sp. EM1]|eukprot:CCW60328.1 unnamed protein product [Phytomonas sp. isolate EM1]
MLFEPCGNLLQDYSACCEVLRLTEREEVYSSVMTSETILKQRETYTTCSSEAENVGFGNNTILSLGEDSFQSSKFADKGAVLILTASTNPEDQNDASRRRRDSLSKLNSSAQSANRKRGSFFQIKGLKNSTALEGNASGGISSSTKIPFTIVSLRNAKFCINQRDMAPLTRAIPHCTSLVSVEMVRCGLSVESYMLLVESIFKSRLVINVAVDFNYLPHVGFVVDPTLPPSETFAAERGNKTESKGVTDMLEVAVHNPELNIRTPTPVRTEAGTGRSKKRPQSPGSNSVLAAPREKAKSTTIIAPVDNRPSTIYLNPTELCGLHFIPTLLEEQLQEEKGRKGKVDPKKLSQLQSQQEMLQQFNDSHRIMVPRGWEGMLFTGVRYLSLRGNGIDDMSIKCIVETILNNPYTQLLSLNLWGNRITDIGASYLAVLLRKNRILRALDIGHNLIGDIGLLDIIDSFRMVELAGVEQIAAYRYLMLTRPGASEAERAAAQQAVPPTAYPTYQDLYNQWFSQVIRPSLLFLDEKGAGAPSCFPFTRRRSLTYNVGKNTGSKGTAGSANKSDAIFAVQRPTTPFDRFCIRVPVLDETGAATSGFIVRAPGNTVLEILNLGENESITLAGAMEACRRLSMHEPRTDEEMQTMSVPSETSSRWNSASVDRSHCILPEATVSNASNKANTHCTNVNLLPPSVHTPELHCAGLRLQTCIVSSFQYNGRYSWTEMQRVQQQIQETLDRWPALNAECVSQTAESLGNQTKMDEQTAS